jgi:hypothetical protein
VAVFAACGGDSNSSTSGNPSVAAAAGAAYAHPELLAETLWLQEHLADASLVIVDLRPRSAFDKSHIPGAV